MKLYILTDIEGTTTPIHFVHDVLFPYSRQHLAAFVDDPERRAELERWIDEDRKEPALKALQGRIWRQGYESGALVSELYPDVKPALTAWKAQGMTLGVYSSGSVEAQKLLFKYTNDGDLTPLFSHYFDTTVGAKRDSASYEKIVQTLRRPAESIIFLSDVVAELDAAKAAGLRTMQLVRPGTEAGAEHQVVRDFNDVSAQL